MSEHSTADLVLQALEPHGLKPDGAGKYRSNRPWSPGSDSKGLTLTINDPEHGAYNDHVSGEGGSLYQLAERLGIERPAGRLPAIETKRGFENLDDYARAHGVADQVFIDAGWKETTWQDRPALIFPTTNGERVRFLDGKLPIFKPAKKGYEACWYGLQKARLLADQTGQPLVICNGEPSVIVGQHYGIAAAAVNMGEGKKLNDDLLLELKREWGGEILIAPDCDETGRKMAEIFYQALSEGGYDRVRVLDLNGGAGFDLADFCALHGPGSTKALIELNNLALPRYTKISRQRRWTVAELIDTDFPEPNWSIPDIIPEGLVMLGGRPKVGKSWLLLQMAHSIGTGGMFFDRKVKKGRVLLLAYEDNPRRLKARIEKMKIPRDALIDFQTGWKPLQNGGLDDLLIEMERGDYRMIAIDTLTRAMPGIDPKKDEGTISRVFDDLQALAINRGQNVTLADHTRKPTGFASDPIDDIMSLTTKTAISDAVLALYKEQGRPGAILKGRGRDIEDINLQLFWDVTTGCWQSQGDADEVNADTFKGDILRAIRELTEVGELATTTSIATHLDADKGNISRALVDLVMSNQIVRLPKAGRQVPYTLGNI